MKKLLIAADSFLPRFDGVSSFLLEVIPRLRQEYDITVVAPDLGEDPNIEGIRLVRFPLSKITFGDFPLSTTKLKVLRKEVKDADVVWTHSIGPIGWRTILLSRLYKKPVAAFIHSLEWELFPKSVKWFRPAVHLITLLFTQFVYNQCTMLMVPTLEVGELVTAQRIWTRKEIVPLGIDTLMFKPPHDKKAAKQKIGIAPNWKVIGFTGRIAREKDILTLHKAYLRIKKRHHHLKLIIVGEGLNEIKDEMRGDSNVIFVGATPKVVDYLQAMDVFVLPSLTETTSLATLEAMACGAAVICTPVGHIKKYIKDKENGFLFPKGNSLVLSLKLDWVLKNNYLREAVGKAARKTVEEGYSWGTTIRRIRETLAEL
ncbi:MAG: glycosyltransferase family 4 protein [Nanoarchaeota archaeon]|nr:glycosyltransferase family 4 protein [Nanoarchaeota archaeon]